MLANCIYQDLRCSILFSQEEVPPLQTLGLLVRTRSAYNLICNSSELQPIHNFLWLAELLIFRVAIDEVLPNKQGLEVFLSIYHTLLISKRWP